MLILSACYLLIHKFHQCFSEVKLFPKLITGVCFVLSEPDCDEEAGDRNQQHKDLETQGG